MNDSPATFASCTHGRSALTGWVLPCLPVLLWGLLHAGGASAVLGQDFIADEEKTVRSAAEEAGRSVVRIETFGGLEAVNNRLVGTGPTTGVIVGEDGYILSSAFNFIQMPSSILVTLPSGDRHPAQLVATDKSRKLVLLKIEAEGPLPVPKFIARDQVRVGQRAIALGRTYPGDLPNISAGIVSATHRIWGRAVQTDAKISPANYGGPLVDLQGQIIGILVPLSPQQQTEVAGAEWYDSGIGFAVPLDEVMPLLDRLKAGEDLFPGILGVSLKGTDLYAKGVEVAAVAPKSPAYEAGIKAGDTIVEIDGAAIVRQAQMKHALGPKYAGQTVNVVVERGDDAKRVDFDVELTDTVPPYEHPFAGFLPVRQPTDEGVYVRFVYPDSGAADAGLLEGDLVKKIDEEPVASRFELQNLVARYEPGNVVKLLIDRTGEELTLEVKLSTLPTQTPDELTPELDIPGPEEAVEGLPVGSVDIEIPEENNKCTAIIPETYHAGQSFGLLVWIRPPGEFDETSLVDQWKEIADTYHLIVVSPQPANNERWVPTEIEFIRKVMDDVMTRYAIDPTRVVVHGYQAGAAMGYLVGFSHRDLVRGIAPLNAALPGRVRIPANEPTQRLAIYSIFHTEAQAARAVKEGQTRLRELKYPVTSIEYPGEDRYLTADELLSLARWIDTLDRI